MSDTSSVVVHAVAAILEISKEIEKKLKGYLIETDTRPEISYELLRVLNLSDDLVQYANPEKTSGEYFGLGKDVVAGAKSPMTFSNNMGWDFLPWFGEKSSNVKVGVKKLIKYWETDPDTVKLSEDAPMSPKEWVRYGIDSNLHQINTYAKVIFDQVFNDKIKVEE